MLIQVPAATKIVGLIFCGVMVMANAASSFLGMFSEKPHISDYGSHYEILTPLKNGMMIVNINKNIAFWEEGFDECEIVNKNGERVKQWVLGENLNSFCNKLTKEEKSIYDKYVKLVESKQSYQELLNDCKDATSKVVIERYNPESPLVCGKYRDYSFIGKVYDSPSDSGIDGGRISKLTIRNIKGDLKADYDRGWSVKPKKKDMEAYQLIKDSLEHFK